MALHHVNFHTLLGSPVFADQVFDQMLRGCLADVLVARGILCLAWEVMPNHVHMIIEDFPDLPRSTILKHVKGDTSRAFFARFPEMRLDMRGGHLWKRGYYAVHIVTHRQYLATLHYVRNNRSHADLPLPQALGAVGGV
jgi:putative transposase